MTDLLLESLDREAEAGCALCREAAEEIRQLEAIAAAEPLVIADGSLEVQEAAQAVIDRIAASIDVMGLMARSGMDASLTAIRASGSRMTAEVTIYGTGFGASALEIAGALLNKKAAAKG